MLPNRPSGRKRWNLHDGPQGSLRRLRNQLAEDGCADSQVVLAKQLLAEKCELEADKISNFKQALEWLVCATEQGHTEARRLLRRCVRSGVVDEDSAAIVRAKACLAASRQETVARKAARDLFASLSNGEQYITTVQLEKRIREICNVTIPKESAEDSDTIEDESVEYERLDEAAEEQALEPSFFEAGDQILNNGTLRTTHNVGEDYPEPCTSNDDIRNLTVENLVSAAVDYCQGELPLVSHELTLTDPGIKALDHIPLLHQAFIHPIIFLKVLYLKLLYYFGGFSFRLTNVELSLILIAYLSVSADSLSHFVPLVLYYVSFVVMVICTFKMLHAKRQFIDFRMWSGLFLRYSDGNLQPDESENLFVRNNLGPFVQFFLGLLVNLFIYPFIATQWVPFSEFCVLSFFLMFLTLLSFGVNGSPYPDFLALVSFSINVLAKYPYEKDTVVHRGWRFLDLHIQNYPSYILGNSIEFCLNARVFFSLLIPAIVVCMARRCRWHGFFKYALPHCVTLSWLQMFIMCSHGCTTYGLIRGTLALVCSFLFLPLIGVLTLLLPIFACLQCITLSKLVYTASIVSCFGLSLALTCILARSEATKKFVTPFQLIVGFVTLVYFGNQLVGNIQDAGLPSSLLDIVNEKKTGFRTLLKNEFADTDYEDTSYRISWDDYYTNCQAPSWTETNMAATQIKCSVLEGTNIDWEGYVTEVKLKSIRNKWSDFANVLPELAQEYFRCYFGEEFSSLCQSSESPHSVKDCAFMQNVARQTGKTCHLNNLDEYIYEVKVMMEASGGILKRHSEVSVTFDNMFSNFTRSLRTDDKIQFKGTLVSSPEKVKVIGEPTILAYEATCLQCKDNNIHGVTLNSKAPSISKFSDLYKTIVNDCVVSTKYILNFILNPVVVLK